MSEVSEANQQRRTFLGILLGGISAVLAAALAWPLFRYLAPRGGGDKGAKVKVPRDKVKVGEAYFFTFRGHPAVVLQPKAGDFIALTAVCTHLGCIVKWVSDKGEFLCPCHGGRYSAQGKVLSGPPPRPLESYPIKIEDTELVVG